jgi:hypothetical protein
MPAERAARAAAALAEQLELGLLARAVDPLPQPALVTAVCARSVPLHLLTAQSAADTLRPEVFKALWEVALLDAVVYSPVGCLPYVLLQVALLYVRELVCAFVEYGFWTGAPPLHGTWFPALAAHGLLHICPVKAEEEDRVEGIWIIVFKYTAARRRLLRPGVALTCSV